MVPHIKMRESGSKVDTTVAVKVLDSPLLTLSVPAELEMQDPAFIQYVAKEALVLYKQKLNSKHQTRIQLGQIFHHTVKCYKFTPESLLSIQTLIKNIIYLFLQNCSDKDICKKPP